MRVTSSFWVSALVRRCFGVDAFAAVVRRGAEEAGAIFVKINRLDGTADLYGPVPQVLVPEEAGGERHFERLLAAAPEAAADDRLAREIAFDGDLWIVEIEDRGERRFFPVIES